jgi:sarcosine oxidase
MMRPDIVVIGAGMIGASAALALARAGVSVTLIGPREPDDKATATGPFASHYDEGRITRIADPDPLWAGWAAESIACYADIEAASGIRFHHPVGSVRVAPAGSPGLARARAAARALGAAVEEIDGRELAARCPAFATREGVAVLWEAAPAGHVNPRRKVAALKVAARRAGATLIETEATAVATGPGGAEVALASGERVACGRVLVATGPHARDRRLLPVLPGLKPVGRTVVQFKVATDDPLFRAMPSFIVGLDPASPDSSFYGVAPVPYPGGGLWLKAGNGCIDSRLPDGAAVRDWFHSGGSREEVRHIREEVLTVFPALSAARWRTEPCALVETDSGRPFIGRVPGHERIGIALGCNGYAAKSCIALGRIAADMIRDDGWCGSEEAGPLRPAWAAG